MIPNRVRCRELVEGEAYPRRQPGEVAPKVVECGGCHRQHGPERPLYRVFSLSGFDVVSCLPCLDKKLWR